jgi:dephospho-CoA kinase
VVFSAPLLVETGMHTAFDLLIVVSAPVATQIERLMRDRGMAERDVQTRIAAQLPVEAKAEVADILVDNEGTLEDLEHRVELVWRDLDAQARAGAR